MYVTMDQQQQNHNSNSNNNKLCISFKVRRRLRRRLTECLVPREHDLKDKTNQDQTGKIKLKRTNQPSVSNIIKVPKQTKYNTEEQK